MICSKCGINKPITDFYSDKTGYIRKVCKKCTIAKACESQKKHREQRKQYCKEYHANHKEKRALAHREYRDRIDALKTPCCKCGDTRLYVIDFHHIDPTTKSFNINRKTAKTNFQVIEKEVSKCVCLCRNCHMEFHHFYGQKPKDPIQALNNYLSKEKTNESI